MMTLMIRKHDAFIISFAIGNTISFSHLQRHDYWRHYLLHLELIAIYYIAYAN